MMAHFNGIFLLASLTFASNIAVAKESIPQPCEKFPPMAKFNFPSHVRGVEEKKSPNGSVTYQIKLDSKDLPSFKVQKIPAKRKSRGTVLYMCGGPAKCNENAPALQLPSDVDVIMFDYLGGGDNAHVKDPSKMTLDSQAEAAKAVVKALNLKNYVMTGWSFGTAVATVAAAKIANDTVLKANQPTSVVLDSTIFSKNTGQTDFGGVSRRAFSLLTENEKSQFRTIVQRFNSENPKLAPRLHAVFLGADLRRGARFTVNDIRTLNQVGADETIKKWKAALESNVSMDDEFHTPTYRAAGCEANNHDAKEELSFLFAEGLVAAPPDNSEAEFCRCRTSSTSYDSRNYKIRAPIIYINGTTDPLTTYDKAKLHEQHQDLAPLKTFISVPDGGHTSVVRDLSECRDQIYSVAFAPKQGSFASLPNLGNGCRPVEGVHPIETAR